MTTQNVSMGILYAVIRNLFRLLNPCIIVRFSVNLKDNGSLISFPVFLYYFSDVLNRMGASADKHKELVKHCEFIVSRDLDT